MKLRLHNTLSRGLEVFEPLDPNMVKMYVCGPTVYDHPHIGNARSVVLYDLLYRLLLELFSGKVTYVRNITDVDDKIIIKAKESGVGIREITEKVENDFHFAMRYLGCLDPNLQPRATEHIHDMIDMIQKLISSNHAYVSDDNHVYFKVASAANYTKLSGRSLDEMLEAVRIEKSNSKNDSVDFILWKPGNADDPASSNFDSPWGLGRPGWHIECSAMSHKYLGADFDIHGGGADLIFPHHTNEIAQSTCAFKGSSFAKFWVHNGFLTVNGQKMSKSLGNFITVKDLIEQNVKGEAIRLLLLSTSYRKPLDFSQKALDDAIKTLNYWYRAMEHVEYHDDADITELLEHLCNDMNTPKAVAFLNNQAKLLHSDLGNKQEVASKFYKSLRLMGFMTLSPQEWFESEKISDEIMLKIEQRAQAKVQKNWALADQIRMDLSEQGIILEDSKDGGTSWKKST